ncbi:MAG: PAS domain S-box protein, partial [Spirochaetota bacterium]
MNPSNGKDESLNSLSVILHLTQKLHNVQDVDSISQNYLAIVRKCNGSPIAGIYRYNPEEHSIKLIHSRGFTKKIKTHLEQLPFKASHAKLRFSNNLDDDAEIDDTTRSVLKQAGLASTVSIPLTCRDEIFGILILLFKESQVFSEIDTMIFTSLGIIISTAIANTSLLSTLKTESKQGNKMRSALSGAGIGLMEWNIAGKTVHADKTCVELLGHGNSEHDFSIDQWEELIHPDDLASVRPRIDACVSGNTVNYEIEFRLRSSENPCKWLLHIGKIIAYTEKGAPALLAGTVLDITRRKTAEMSLAESEEKFRTFTEFSPIPIMIYQDNKWIYANPAAIKITGYSGAELLTMNFWEFVHPDFRDLIK